MKKMKNNLDERQELKLLRIEHNGCWLAFWGLLIVMLIQLLTGNDSDRESCGRMDCIYVSCSISYNRLYQKWNLGQKAAAHVPRTNLMASSIAAVVTGDDRGSSFLIGITTSSSGPLPPESLCSFV